MGGTERVTVEYVRNTMAGTSAAPNSGPNRPAVRPTPSPTPPTNAGGAPCPRIASLRPANVQAFRPAAMPRSVRSAALLSTSSHPSSRRDCQSHGLGRRFDAGATPVQATSRGRLKGLHRWKAGAQRAMISFLRTVSEFVSRRTKYAPAGRPRPFPSRPSSTSSCGPWAPTPASRARTDRPPAS